MESTSNVVICKICGLPWERKKRQGFICHKCHAKQRRANRKCAECGGAMHSDSAKLCPSCRASLVGQGMEQNRNWKGGKVRHYKGYIAIKHPEHPKAWAGSGYVFEHILVMEEALGRYLYDSETVHHKNGAKDDNRLENLELWASSHPAGQRTADLVEFAIEILGKYAPERLK